MKTITFTVTDANYQELELRRAELFGNDSTFANIEIDHVAYGLMLESLMSLQREREQLERLMALTTEQLERKHPALFQPEAVPEWLQDMSKREA